MGYGNKTVKNVAIGVTGVIASGKSTLCRYLHENHDFHWIHTDEIAHELYDAGRPGYQKIKEFFGTQFVNERHVLRGRLRRLVAKSPQKMWILSKLMHPLIAHEVNKKIVQINRDEKGKTRRPVCIEAIFFETSDLETFIDHLIKVNSTEEVIVKRLRGRDVPLEYLKQLLKFQRRHMPEKGTIVMNTGSLNDFFAKAWNMIQPWVTPEDVVK
ncbi:MAG: Dephospho-CoA kinase [Candidatus Peregrinibacteria bacterium GW2011_GWA2_47_7]|nr:MAG: Dephospho-CoA kinase [Candidatus Peregrinibacteria bacterium GW2011_GWA2_47_7]